MPMWEHVRQTLIDNANGTKRGSIARQRLIEREAAEALDIVRGTSLMQDVNVRAFLSTWVEPTLARIVQAASGEQVTR